MLGHNVSQFQTRWEGLRITNGQGCGFIAQGSRDWKNYRANAEIVPLSPTPGLGGAGQGRERYYALMFDKVGGGRIKLVRRDHDETILASHRFRAIRPGIQAGIAGHGSKIEPMSRESRSLRWLIRRINAGRRRGRPCGRHRIDCYPGCSHQHPCSVDRNFLCRLEAVRTSDAKR